jgi:hypothetical protein
MPKKTAPKPAQRKPLDFETFVRAAMQTGNAPQAAKKRKAKGK